MVLVKWDEKYSVGLESIDTQHKTLVGLINQLHEAMKLGRSKELIKPTLDSLTKYTKEHFTFEEEKMQAVNYPGLAEHRNQHEEFVKKVDAFVADYDAGRAGLTFAIINFLRDWLLHHIADTDKKYSSYLQP